MEKRATANRVMAPPDAGMLRREAGWRQRRDLTLFKPARNWTLRSGMGSNAFRGGEHAHDAQDSLAVPVAGETSSASPSIEPQGRGGARVPHLLADVEEGGRRRRAAGSRTCGAGRRPGIRGASPA